MCLVQSLILYHFYLHMYAFIVLTLNMHIHKIHHLQESPVFITEGIEKHLTSLLLPDIPGRSRRTLPTLQE